MLKTKTVDDKAADGDGYRLLITREWPPGRAASFADGFNPKLAPSQELHDALRGKRISPEQFREKYLTELEGCKERLASINKQAEKFDITLVAYPDLGGAPIGKIVWERCRKGSSPSGGCIRKGREMGSGQDGNGF